MTAIISPPEPMSMDFLVIDDDKTFRDATCAMIEAEGHYGEGTAAGHQGLRRLKEEKFDAVLLDLSLGPESGLDVLVDLGKNHPTLPVVMLTAHGDLQTAVEAMRRGCVDFLEKPFEREQFLTVLARLQRIQQLDQRIQRLEQEVADSKVQQVEPMFDLTAPPMRAVMDILERAAPSSASILILGESGTGKTVIARLVHQRSQLADRPFVTVSCPSLSKELLESDLFGHVRGAFTGAVKDHWGKVRAAEGGTLFLDEIGDLPMEVQPKLLRLLQEREYERLGENVTRRANLRVIAATNRDLKQRVAEGAFREDLFFRLNVITLVMPPLRDLQSDLIRLAEHYARHFAAQCGRRLNGFTADALACLRAYSWPGNLRELRNAIERAVILTQRDDLGKENLPPELHSQAVDPQAPEPAVGGMLSLDALEASHIRKVLQSVPVLSEAAAILGIDQATLYRKRKKLGLD
jgi:two-component system, NtrC family, response regulator AlgB